jgi:hypothetical protein
MKAQDARRDVSFHHLFYRTNPDKEIDAICGFCCLPASTPNNLADLHVRERASTSKWVRLRLVEAEVVPR